MLRAVELSQEGMHSNNGGPFGAIIAKTGGKPTDVVGEGFNRVLSSNDPTAHAEVIAIRSACQTLGDFNLSGYSLFSSCEPCPMCLAAACWARLDVVYFANTRSDAAAIGFDDAAIYDEVAMRPEKRQMIRTIHVGLPEAANTFRQWSEKEDRIEY